MAKDKSDKSWFARHKLLTVILAFIGILVVATAIGGGSDTDTNSSRNSSSANENTSENQPEAGIGTSVRDGKFEFVVNSAPDCSKKTLGNQFVNTEAQGTFCLISVTVTNIGNEAQYMFADNQYAFNASNQKYSADSSAAIYMDDSSKTLWEEINPGNKVTGYLVYDVPAGTELVSLELHDSAFSGGVKVSLK